MTTWMKIGGQWKSSGGTDISIDSAPTKNSANAVSSNGVYDALTKSLKVPAFDTNMINNAFNFNTWYRNNTGRPVFFWAISESEYIRLQVGRSTSDYASIAGHSDSNNADGSSTVYGIIPSGYFWLVNKNGIWDKRNKYSYMVM